VRSEWSSTTFTGTYADAKEKSVVFITYKQTTKREWVTERQNLVTLFSNVQTKLKTYGLREYVPPKGLSLLDLDNAWKQLLKSEADWSRKINDEIRRFDFIS